MSIRRDMAAGLACTLAGAALAVVAGFTVLRDFEAYAADLLVSQHARHLSARDDLLILAIDDQSMEGRPFQSPIDRSLLASVVQGLDRRGAKVIALDIVLDRPSFPESDAALAAAMAAARATVIAGVDPGAEIASAACGADGRRAAAQPGGQLLASFAELARPASLVLCVDGDGVARRTPQPAAGGGSPPLLAEAVAAAMADRDIRATGEPIRFGLSDDGQLPFPVYSASALDLLPAEWISGKAVLVGAIQPYSGDWLATPLGFSGVQVPVEPAGLLPSGRLPGVAVHAFQVATLLDGAPGPARTIWGQLAMALAGGALGAWLAGAWRTGREAATSGRSAFLLRGLAGLVLLPAGPAMAILAFDAAGWLLPVAVGPLALLTAAACAITFRERRTSAQKQRIRRAFEHFLAPQVVARLVRDPDSLALGAAPREISVLFTDLAGFSRFIDTHPPEVSTRVVNAYLETVMAQVRAHGGVIDKIVGDAVHAFFSAPVADPDHRAKAVRCALAIDAAAERFRAQVLAREGVALGETRIGVHAGVAMVGNFGGPDRFDYTAHGSVINAAARLEAANKVFGGRICVSEAVREDAAGLGWRAIGRVILRGIEAPVQVFAPVREDLFPREVLAEWSAAMQAVESGDPEARTRLEAFAARFPDDPLARFHLARLVDGVPAQPFPV